MTIASSKTTPTPGNLANVLRAILAEVTPGQRPYSGDSYLPSHLIDEAQAAGLIPKLVKIGPRAVGLPDYEVRAVMAARVAGKSDSDIRALVLALEAKRSELALALSA